MATEVERIELIITTDNKAAIKSLKQMQKDLGGTGKQAKKTSTVLTALAGRSALAASAINKTTAAAAAAAPAFRLAAGAAKLMITTLGIGAAAFLLLGVSAIKGASDAEKALTEVATLADFTTREIDQMRQGTRLLAIQFGQSFKTISAARFDVVSSGFTDVAEQQDLLTKGFKLGVANATDVSVATKALTGTLKAFSLEASEANRVMDELTAISQGSKTNLDGLAGSIAKVAPTAVQAGQSLATVGAALDILTLAGISAEESATALRAGIRSIVSPATQKNLEGAGIAVKDTNGEFRNFRDILVDLSKFPPEKIAKLFPSEEAQLSVGVLIKNLDDFGIKLDEISSKDIAGLTEKSFAKASDTLAFQLDRLAQAWTTALTSSIDEGIIGSLTRGARAVADFVQDEFDEIKVLQKKAAALIDREQEILNKQRERTGLRRIRRGERAELEANRSAQEKLQKQIADIGQAGRDEEEAKIVADAKETTEKKEKVIAEETLAKRKQLNVQIRQLELQSAIAATDDVVEQERLKWDEVIRQAKENLATREQLVRLNALAEAAIARKSEAELEKEAKKAAEKTSKRIDARIDLREKIAAREEEIAARTASKSEKIFTEEAAKEDDIVRAANERFTRGQITKAELNEILIASEQRLRDVVAERIETEKPEEEEEEEEARLPFDELGGQLDEVLDKIPLLEDGLASSIPTFEAVRASSDAAGAALIGQAVAGKISGKALGKAAQEAAVQVLKANAAKAAGEAIFQTASGFAQLALAAFGVPGAAVAAAAHFTAAAGFAQVAAVSGGLAAAAGGGGGGGGGGAGGGAQDDVTRAQQRRRDADLDERLGTPGGGVTIINNITGVANRAQLAALADQNAAAARVQFDDQVITQNLGTISGQ